MDATLAKIALLMAAHVALIDINQVHRNYYLAPGVKALIFFHHVIISVVVLGIFLVDKRLVRMHLVATFATVLTWFLMDGCFIVDIQREFIKYFPNDDRLIHGTYDEQVRNQLIIGVPIILYDFYKLLV